MSKFKKFEKYGNNDNYDKNCKILPNYGKYEKTCQIKATIKKYGKFENNIYK